MLVHIFRQIVLEIFCKPDYPANRESSQDTEHFVGYVKTDLGQGLCETAKFETLHIQDFEQAILFRAQE